MTSMELTCHQETKNHKVILQLVNNENDFQDKEENKQNNQSEILLYYAEQHSDFLEMNVQTKLNNIQQKKESIAFPHPQTQKIGMNNLPHNNNIMLPEQIMQNEKQNFESKLFYEYVSVTKQSAIYESTKLDQLLFAGILYGIFKLHLSLQLTSDSRSILKKLILLAFYHEDKIISGQLLSILLQERTEENNDNQQLKGILSSFEDYNIVINFILDQFENPDLKNNQKELMQELSKQFHVIIIVYNQQNQEIQEYLPEKIDSIKLEDKSKKFKIPIIFISQESDSKFYIYYTTPKSIFIENNNIEEKKNLIKLPQEIIQSLSEQDRNIQKQNQNQFYVKSSNPYKVITTLKYVGLLYEIKKFYSSEQQEIKNHQQEQNLENLWIEFKQPFENKKKIFQKLLSNIQNAKKSENSERIKLIDQIQLDSSISEQIYQYERQKLIEQFNLDIPAYISFEELIKRTLQDINKEDIKWILFKNDFYLLYPSQYIEIPEDISPPKPQGFFLNFLKLIFCFGKSDKKQYINKNNQKIDQSNQTISILNNQPFSILLSKSSDYNQLNQTILYNESSSRQSSKSFQMFRRISSQIIADTSFTSSKQIHNEKQQIISKDKQNNPKIIKIEENKFMKENVSNNSTNNSIDSFKPKNDKIQKKEKSKNNLIANKKDIKNQNELIYEKMKDEEQKNQIEDDFNNQLSNQKTDASSGNSAKTNQEVNQIDYDELLRIQNELANCEALQNIPMSKLCKCTGFIDVCYEGYELCKNCFTRLVQNSF